MTKFTKKCSNALNDGYVKEPDKLYNRQFDKKVYFTSLFLVVAGYAIVTYYASEIYAYIGSN